MHTFTQYKHHNSYYCIKRLMLYFRATNQQEKKRRRQTTLKNHVETVFNHLYCTQHTKHICSIMLGELQPNTIQYTQETKNKKKNWQKRNYNVDNRTNSNLADVCLPTICRIESSQWFFSHNDAVNCHNRIHLQLISHQFIRHNLKYISNSLCNALLFSIYFHLI